jgi:hypothetical protein
VIHIDIDHFRARILQDALTEATAAYWVHRAHQFRQAAPNLGEFHGDATRDELNEAWTRCHATAQACLAHADLLRGDYPRTHQRRGHLGARGDGLMGVKIDDDFTGIQTTNGHQHREPPPDDDPPEQEETAQEEPAQPAEQTTARKWKPWPP